MSSYPGDANKLESDARSQRPGPLLTALGEVYKLNDLLNETPYSSDDFISEEDSHFARHYSKQEELVNCLLRMKDLMEEAELESMRLKEEKKLLTKRIGESLMTVNTEMDSLKQQLKDQDEKLKEIGASPVASRSNERPTEYSTGISVLVSEQTEQIISLQKKLLVFEEENAALKKQMYGGRKMSDDQLCPQCKRLQEYAGSLEVKLQKYKDASIVMRRERKQLKSEKLELLDQLKQLYATLEDKEKELREFILNYEQRMKYSEETINQLLAEKAKFEKERWDLLKRVAESSERCINLKTELDSAEENLRLKEEELGKFNQSESKDGAIFEFFGLFGKETPPKEKNEPEEQKNIAPYFEEANTTKQDEPYDSRKQHRPQELALSSYNSLERNSAILACSTPVSDAVDTQYLSLGSPEVDRSTKPSFNRAIDRSADRSSNRLTDRPSDRSMNSPTRSPPPAYRQPDRTLSPSKPQKPKSPTIKRSVSLRSRDSPKKSPRAERKKSCGSPISSSSSKLVNSPLSNGSVVVRRQGSMNRRPRTFHPDLIDAAEMIKEEPKLSVPSPDPSEPKSPRRRRLTETISKIFSKDKEKDSAGSEAKTPEEELFDKWNIWDSIQRVPMALWKARDVVVWLEIECCLPMYAQKCSHYVKSGRVLLQMTEQELASLLGIANPMHKLKLRLALDDHRYPDRKNINLSKLDHVWMSYTWLKDLGLSQFSAIFEKNLVDCRMANTFSKKDLEKHFGMTKKFNQVSFFCGLQLLRKLNFNKDALGIRRANCADADIDVIVWTNQRLVQWALSVDFKEYAHRLRESGVHGAVIVLEETFTIDSMAAALGIPTGKNSLYQHLTSEFSPLLKSSRSKLAQDDRLKNGKPKHGGLSRSFSLRWSRRDKSKKLSPARSTGNINCNTAPAKESHLTEEKASKSKMKTHATLL